MNIQYLTDLIKEFDIEIHLGNAFYPDYNIDWRSLELDTKGVDYIKPLGDHQSLFRQESLETLEKLTRKIQGTGRRISVRFDENYNPIFKIKDNSKRLVEVE